MPGEGFSHRSHQGGKEQPQGERRKEPGHQPDQSGSQQHAGQDAPELSRGMGRLFHLCSSLYPSKSVFSIRQSPSGYEPFPGFPVSGVVFQLVTVFVFFQSFVLHSLICYGIFVFI